MERETFVMPPCLCPTCGAKLDMATHPVGEGAAPHVGDFSMCLDCGTALRWGDKMIVRVATPEDLAELPPELARLMIAMAVVRKIVVPPRVPPVRQ